MAQSLGEDATLSDVLQMLYKHYGVVMMFDTLSKEFYSLEHRFREKVVEYEVHLSASPDNPSQSTQEGFGLNMWRI